MSRSDRRLAMMIPEAPRSYWLSQTLILKNHHVDWPARAHHRPLFLIFRHRLHSSGISDDQK